MNNPKLVAVVSGVAALFLAYSIFGATEAPGTAVSAMNWVFFILALVACAGSLYKISRGD
ncbi:hypothetical protein [Shinella pollutisoli]|uniref:Uncharacterized protein n=1 Tax=Shinella pollutisoli TaxID=2250594 RepID=A0ABV7DHQ0_9HYPH|nr:hypothetical protein [Shinella pollutisoli]